MVRTYTWNPSTQSSLAILGNFNNEDEKTITSSLPTASTSLYPNQCFSTSPIYRPKFKSGQVTSIPTATPKEGPQNNAALTSSEILSSTSSHGEYPMNMLESQTTSLWQPRHQNFPVTYSIPVDFSCSLCHWRPHLLAPQIAAPIMLEPTTHLRPIDLWQLRPVQIGDKVYYEPVKSHISNGTTPMSVGSVNEQDSKMIQPEAIGIHHPTTSSNTSPADLPWTCTNPPQKSGIGGTPSWQIPCLVKPEELVFDTKTNANRTLSTNHNSHYQIASSHQTHHSPYQDYFSQKIVSIPSQQWNRKITATESTEQYKRDLQLQIEQNHRRREEERQRELEMERKEMIKFEEYKRKVQEEIEEEERKEKEKILAAQRRAARMRALQEEAETKAYHEAENRTRRSEGTRKREKRTSSTAESNRLEWWEKKKEHINDNAARRVHSPVIPALRNKNETFGVPSQNTVFEISRSNPGITNCFPSDRPTRSRSSSRLSRRCYHSSMTSRQNSSSHSTPVRQRTSQIYHHKESSSSNS
uniref:Uncharacterized protein n=1 Tax=Setaria digitata TaxID=48799 RepID=A0A915PP61_9BILA